MPESLYLALVYSPMALLLVGVFSNGIFKTKFNLMLMAILSGEYAFWELFKIAWESSENFYKNLVNGLGFSQFAECFYYWIYSLAYIVIGLLVVKYTKNNMRIWFAVGYFIAAFISIVSGLSYSAYGSETWLFSNFMILISAIMAYLVYIAAKDGWNGQHGKHSKHAYSSRPFINMDKKRHRAY